MRKILFLFFFIATGLPLFAQVAYTPNAAIPLDTAVRHGVLPNGMTYYVQYNSKPDKRVEMRLAVNAGSMQEDDNQQGLAHFCEHMAFNGTTHFTHNQVVDFLEGAGMRFGADLNAYTSFDETVYMLQLPTDSIKLIQQGFQVLEDWAHSLLFDPVEIDKERGVVTEEWRLGQGANERMRRQYFPVLFENSRYALRLPIGKMDIIKNCPYDTLRKFYKDYYQPRNMAVVIVGDINPAEMEAYIKQKFSSIPNAPGTPMMHKYAVPDNDKLLVAKATDKEAQYTSVQISFRQTQLDRDSTLADMRRHILYELFTGMLNDRLGELAKKPDASWVFARTDYSNEVRTKTAFSVFALANEGKSGDVLKTLLNECFRVRAFGFTQSELDRQKKSVLSDLEQEYNEKNKTESRNIVTQYVYNFLEKEPVPGIAFEYQFNKWNMDGISLAEVNALAAQFIQSSGHNTVIVLTGPDKSSGTIPDTAGIRKIFQEAQSAKPEAWVDQVNTQPLMTTTDAPGKITDTKTLDAVGVTEWTLSNGAHVLLKPTDFKNDEIKMMAYAFGGTSLYSNQDYVSAEFAANIADNSGLANYDATQLEKYLEDKKIQITPYMQDVNAGFQGSSSVKDLPTFMSLLNLYMTSPRKDSTGYLVFRNQILAMTKNKGNDPAQNLRDTVDYVMGSHHFRARPFNEAQLNELSFSRAYQIYQERFSDPSEFTFTFVGSFTLDEMKPLVEKYLASIPAKNKKDTWKDAGVRTPAGVVNKMVYKGTEPKASVVLKFTGPFVYNRANRNDLNMLTQLMNIKLRETLRENMSGTYGVSASAMPVHYPNAGYTITVQFGCAPENVDALTQAAFRVIDSVKLVGCSATNLNKIRELASHERDTRLKDNSFWVQVISQSAMNQESVLELLDFNKYLDGLTSDRLRDLAKQYFNMNNYAKFVLLPEKK